MAGWILPPDLPPRASLICPHLPAQRQTLSAPDSQSASFRTSACDKRASRRIPWVQKAEGCTYRSATSTAQSVSNPLVLSTSRPLAPLKLIGGCYRQRCKRPGDMLRAERIRGASRHRETGKRERERNEKARQGERRGRESRDRDRGER
jgi:hypothetical protein